MCYTGANTQTGDETMSGALVAFDTLRYAKKLKEVGVPEAQAEVQAEALREQSEVVQEFIEQNLATKGDLKWLEKEMKTELRTVEERLTNRINETNSRINEMSYKITIRLGGMLVAGIIVLGVLIKF